MEDKKQKPSESAPVKVADPDELPGCLALVVLPIVMLVDGVCLSSLWGWFLVPFGLPKIGVAHGIGIMLMRKFFTVGSGTSKDGTTSPLSKKYIVMVVSLKISTMLIGYIVHRFMR